MLAHGTAGQRAAPPDELVEIHPSAHTSVRQLIRCLKIPSADQLRITPDQRNGLLDYWPHPTRLALVRTTFSFTCSLPQTC